MSEFHKPSTTRTFLSFGAVAGISVAAIVAAIWAFGPTPFSETNPYADDITQNPTGAGSNPEGAAAVSVDGIVQHSERGAVINSSSASDVDTVEDRGVPDTIVDEANRLLEPSEANSVENGAMSDRTGTVNANDG